MIPYFILLLIVIVLAVVAKKVRNDKILYYTVISFVYLLLVLFAGLRDSSVGTDTNNYIGMFGSSILTDSTVLEYSGSLELGYVLLQKFVLLFTNEYWLLLTVIAMVSVFFYLRTIYVLSENYGVSIFIFITLGTYLFFFNGARQGLAAAIFSFAVIAAVNGSYKKYYFWILIAFFFHKSVIVAAPFYYFIRQKYSFKNLAILIGAIFVLVLLLYQLLSFLPEAMYERYNEYTERGAEGGYLLTMFYVIIWIFSVFMRNFIPNSKKVRYDIYLNLSTIFTSIFVFVTLFGQDVNLLRLSLYFSLGNILIWPMIFNVLRGYMKYIVLLAFSVVHILFFYIYINKMANLVPYTFNL